MLIALLTDFGTRDYFVGAVKGAILAVNEKATIVDITHDVPPQDIAAAAFTLRACYADFPAKTIFVAVVDPGVGSDRRAILAAAGNYYFIAPDNGLLSFVFREEKRRKVYQLTNESFFAARVSRTFHGRDVFAPVAAHLSKGVAPEEFGAEIANFVSFASAEPKKLSSGEVEAEIIYIDRFGNLITNLQPRHLPGKFTLEIGGRTISRLRHFYAEAEAGELFMIAGSAGFLEIVAFRDSAKKLLRAEIGEKIKLKAV